jgi:L-fuconolactonase
MWGSDWPVCLFAGAYERTFRVVDDYAARLTAAERDALFGGNAAKFYGVA